MVKCTTIGRNNNFASNIKCVSKQKEQWKKSTVVTWMDLESIILSEVRQAEKDQYPMISLIYGIFKKWYKWTYLQNRNWLPVIEKFMITKGESWGKNKLAG